MTDSEGPNAPTVLVRAAIRIVTRWVDPGWRPETNADLDAWGRGFNEGWRQGFRGGRES